MADFFTINGVSSSDYGFEVIDGNWWDAPARSVDVQSVPGRDGDLHMSNNRFENIDLTIRCLCKSDFDTNFAAFKNWILMQDGYVRIESTVIPDEFLTAFMSSGAEPTITPCREVGTVEITFNRKPNRFLKSGEDFVEVASGDTLTNSWQKAKPIIRVYGSGTVTVEGVSVVIAESDYDFIDIDSDIEECYTTAGGTLENCNGLATVSTFPTLANGDSTVNFDGFTKVEIKPRWWRV